MEDTLLNLILRAMRVCNDFGRPSCDTLWWRTDGEYAPVTLFVNCNDLFFWAMADAERVTQGNIAVLGQALEDMLAIDPENQLEAAMLFCCRVRQMRPQQSYYKEIPTQFHALFDACGPAREA